MLLKLQSIFYYSLHTFLCIFLYHSNISILLDLSSLKFYCIILLGGFFNNLFSQIFYTSFSIDQLLIAELF
jgi:hypothetical protein